MSDIQMPHQASTSTLAPTADQMPPDTRFLSRDECIALVRHARSFATGDGTTAVFFDSHWTGNLRWARNRITTGGDVRNNRIEIVRTIRGATGSSSTNRTDDARLFDAVRHAERFLNLQGELPESDRTRQFLEPYSQPNIWSDATYAQQAADRAALMQRLVAPAAAAGMLAAGYVEVSAHGRASIEGDTVWYYPYTVAQYSVTVRDPSGSGSGWAGIDHHDWSKIDADALSAKALDKCLRSRNPVRIEPGRYTVILEPQAVCDLTSILFRPDTLDRVSAELGDPSSVQSEYSSGSPTGYWKRSGLSKIGDRIIDERLTVSVDPMDPELGFPPFLQWQVFHPATWITNGVLTNLAYGRAYAVRKLGQDTGGLSTAGSFRMTGHGPTVSMDEMISTTKRGVIVTRFSDMSALDPFTALMTGYTRDGTWLVENGKISKSVKNLRFTESPFFVLNNVDQIGVSERVFHPGESTYFAGYSPVIVPALKVRDFSFTSISDAV